MNQWSARLSFAKCGAVGAREVAWLLLACLVLAALAIFIASFGAVPIMAPWDVFILLDGGWRIVNGQVPHTDFHNPIGPLTYLLSAAGMMISKPSLGALPIGNLIFLLVTSVIAIHVSFFRRLSGLHAFLFTLFIAVVTTAPRPLGYAPEITSYAMVYNRYGWVLLAILAILVNLPSSRDGKVARMLDDLLAGALLGLLLFCKINFFVAGVVVAAWSVIHRGGRRVQYVLLISSGLLLVCGIAWTVLGISVLDYIRDVLSALRVQSRWERLGRLEWAVRENWLGILLTLAAGTAASLQGASEGWRRAEAGAITALLTLVAVITAAGNTGERSDLPLFFVAGLIACQFMLRDGLDDVRRKVVYALAVTMTAGLLGSPILAKDVRAHLGALERRWSESMSMRDAQGFSADPLRDFYIPADSNWRTAYWRAREVPHRINEGLALLRNIASSETRIFVLALTNPFSFALGLPPPRHTLLWWDANLSFARKAYPDPARTFSDVDLVVVPIFRASDDGCCKQTVMDMREAYGGYLDDHFTEVANSANWRVLKRMP